MKTYLKHFLTSVAVLFAHVLNAQMVMEYQIPTYDYVVTLPLNGNVNVNVNWGDGSPIESFTTSGDKFHTYATVGNRTVTITGTLTHYGNNSNLDNDRLIKVLSWDGLGLTSLAYAFYNAARLIQVPTSLPVGVTDLTRMFAGAISFNQPLDTWNTSKVTKMGSMFYAALSFNQNINNWNTDAVADMSQMFYRAIAYNKPIELWNTSNVTDMNHMFYGAKVFNQPIGAWNTSKVTNMWAMFGNTSAFNQPIGTWITKEVTNMSEMFIRASAFNQPIGSWNTSSVISMEMMFNDATSFNQPIGGWNTAKDTTMFGMFWGASKFDQPIGTWNTSLVKDIYAMFYDAKAFNQPLGSWNIGKVEYMGNMFTGTGLCTSNYDNLLNGWAPQNVYSDLGFDGGSSKYSILGQDSRDLLISKGWTIKDAGLGSSSDARCTVTGIEKSQISSKVIIYPNPVKDYLHMQLSKPGTFVLYNGQGNEVLKTQALESIDLSEFSAGVYFYNIQTESGTQAGKIVKE